MLTLTILTWLAIGACIVFDLPWAAVTLFSVSTVLTLLMFLKR